MNAAAPTRRQLLHGIAAGGFVLAVGLAGGQLAVAGDSAHAAAFAPDAFIRIGTDGATTLIMPQVEMGQGIYTTLAMLIAEELDADLATVTLAEAPPSDALYGNPLFKVQMTGGSTSVRAYFVPMRKAGAAARAMLVQAAAARWNVDPATCTTESGQVHHAASSRSIGYGAVAGAAARLKPPAEPMLKDPKAFRLVGKPHRRLDTAHKVDGSLQYGIDAMPEGVKFATLCASPVLGGKVAHVDDSQAKALPGVRQIIVLDDIVAVVGDHMWAAKQGLDALAITWNDGANAAVSTETLWQGLQAAAAQPGIAVTKGAVVDPNAEGVVSAYYEIPALAHAPMEPMNCTVHVKPGACELWVGTQVSTMAQGIAAKVLGLPPEAVTLNNHLIGGGFGRRLEVDMVEKAVRVAQKVDGPVKVVWTREEDIQKARYRSIYGSWLRAKLDQGKLVAWEHKVVGPAVIARFLPPAFTGGIDPDAIDGAVETPYALPNPATRYVRHEPVGIETCFWRGVGPNNNVFSTECFVDLLANKAGKDPLDYRRSLTDPKGRARHVLDLAAEKAGWGTPLPARSGRGICLQFAFGSYLATIAEVAVADDGTVRVQRLVTAVDCGVTVNPDGVVAQIQGGHVFGLSAVLHQQITLEKGRVQQSNFHDYRVLRIDEMPQIEVHLVPSGEAPGGIGEPGTVSVQPAVANAVYAATGMQLTRMPIDPNLIARKA
ncbi:isoquinoline 1-oxidoreductase, beta subunit [Sphingomonas sp. NFR04]|uniref:xanthine dehydrogenase family protein molybdopterin-binding subunit n=1 Tax=Sphingomonas sp. NFR04 TaxID=1566283 RepID=UPI0008E4528B|nr:molybdopterin cofactor-binding domain-containing protein [Sphingomonas sp. NFR04]SFJ13132.1 isoquinoline 1-oxidoreductase, beta subunit [Sphingomonas sp. NFR04]